MFIAGGEEQIAVADFDSDQLERRAKVTLMFTQTRKLHIVFEI